MVTELINLVGHTTLEVTQDTQFVLDMHNSVNAPVTLELVFNQPHVKAEIIGIFQAYQDKSIDLTTIARHSAPYTSCDTYVKGILHDGGVSHYVGKIIISKSAQNTKSYLHDNVLVVGKNTHNSSQPILQIEANEVMASHGASTGRISPEQLFYLQSRGLDEKESTQYIVMGFLESLISKIHDSKVQDIIRTI